MTDSTTLIASKVFEKDDTDATIQAWYRALNITTVKWSWTHNVSNTSIKIIIAYV